MERLLHLLASWWATPLLLGLARLTQDPAQPPATLGLTGILDGFPAGPRLYAVQYTQFYCARSLRNGAGGERATITLNSLLLLQHISFMAKKKVLGGNTGFDVLLPVVFVDSAGTVGTTPNGQPVRLTYSEKAIGDLSMSPTPQWSNKRLFGKPVSYRVELGFTLPTGAYAPRYLLNPGSN